MRVFAAGALVLTVAACASGVPDSGAGSGGASGIATREAPLQGAPETTAPNVVVPATPGNAAAAADPARVTTHVGISDEQDFKAVSSRETIQSDKERLAAQRQQYRVIAPTALPPRPGSLGPSIVEYALSTTNKVGDSLYRRSSLFAESRYNRNCGKFASPDLAQEYFLRTGGPERDRQGLDPDGDGFACSWDPQPFRTVRQ